MNPIQMQRREKLLEAILFFLALTLYLIVPALTFAQDSFPSECQQGSLPASDPKFPGNQLFLVCIPANWNGNLVLYAHGYVAPQAPLALPVGELTLDGTFVPQLLLAQGFAFATSSYHKNGAAIEQARNDLNDLLAYFKTLIPQGSLQNVLLIGGSEGGLIAVELLERNPNDYDGALALCGSIGGSLQQIHYAYDFRVVFDYFFPTVFTFAPGEPGEKHFGAFDVPENAYLFWENVYKPRIITALTNDPQSAAQLFRITGAAVNPNDPSTAIETALAVLSYNIFGTNDIIATSGGIPYDNRFRIYRGSTNDVALNRGVERIKGDPRAELYAFRFYQTTGELRQPLVTLHNTLDPAVPFRHELTYGALAALQRKLRFVSVLPVPTYGHCEFTTEQILGAFVLLVQQANRPMGR
jgi:pimeloyl-ACP methyl ester carboxylesterase